MELFGPADIKWVRNVKRDNGNDWAYRFEDGTFRMHWSSVYKNGNEAMKPIPGDLILLFQKPNNHIANGLFLTHLVTPIDFVIHDEIQSNPSHRWSRDVMVIGKPQTITEIPKPFNTNFRKVSRGHSFAIERIEVNGETNRQSAQHAIWDAFFPHLKTTTDKSFLSLKTPLFDPELALEEGNEREVLRKHLLRERKPELVAKKKQIDPELLSCECCYFNFHAHFGKHGAGYIECHHREPIHLGKRITTLADLALVCANCHRMLHRKNVNGSYYTIEELKTILNRE